MYSNCISLVKLMDELAKTKLSVGRNQIPNLDTINQEFYKRDTRIVAIELLGKYVVHKLNGKVLIGKIVETEAYLGEIDPACHFYTGDSNRNSAFYQPPGMSYVYLIYGKYHCLNVITKSTAIGGAVLIRALEPVNGIDLMKQLRKKTKIEELCNGPGKLTQALQITMDHNKISLFEGLVTIKQSNEPIKYSRIGVSNRIGITKASDWNLRYFLADNNHVSKHKKTPFFLLHDINSLKDISYYESQFKNK